MIYGSLLTADGWRLVDRQLNPVTFSASHGTWRGLRPVVVKGNRLVEIPVTWTGAEVIAEGEYAGRPVWWTADEPAEGLHVHSAFMHQGRAYPLQVSAYITSFDRNRQPCSVPLGPERRNYVKIAITRLDDVAGWLNVGDDPATLGWSPWTIFTQHLLARMILIEHGTLAVHDLVVDDVPWDGEHRVDYHGIVDPFGSPDNQAYFYVAGLYVVDGNVWIVASDGSGVLVNTGVKAGETGWPASTLTDHVKVDGHPIYLDDAFITAAPGDASSPFGASQVIYRSYGYRTSWHAGRYTGPLHLVAEHHPAYTGVGFRLIRHAVERTPI